MIVWRRYWMNSGLVSITTSLASGAIRSRIGRQKVPTPGPYSTNSLQFAQSTGSSILRISLSDEGTIDPTMTGCFRNPEKNICHGDGTPAGRLRARRVAVVELGIAFLTVRGPARWRGFGPPVARIPNAFQGLRVASGDEPHRMSWFANRFCGFAKRRAYPKHRSCRTIGQDRSPSFSCRSVTMRT
ncbi:hypothetical protein SPHINGO391_390025 [Sphingomonas aurantiaca]|uniref:Uncharacterized protein n=1 Tax=Sphingomonas aurantiaca TaxID=185949 RepID=A0A5E7YKA8_9SPHN|nr:hypothetical protein SPHINGO391_390025 [Sphingomonas aurantiaca]